jgi:hypothetical protein
MGFWHEVQETRYPRQPLQCFRRHLDNQVLNRPLPAVKHQIGSDDDKILDEQNENNPPRWILTRVVVW